MLFYVCINPHKYLIQSYLCFGQAAAGPGNGATQVLRWATQNKKTADVFLIFSEGGEACLNGTQIRDDLKKYRKEMNIPDAR